MLVGAVMGLVVGAIGFFVLAPADAASESGGSGSSGVTVTTSPGAGGTEGEAAAAGQASSPEEQAVYDLAEAFTNEDCESIVAQSDVWAQMFEINISNEEEGIANCEAAFASGELGPVRVYQTWIITSDGDSTRVAALNNGWPDFNFFYLREEDGAWRIYGGDLDGDLSESDSAQSDAEGEGDESGGGSLVDRPVLDPTDPPTGNATYDEIAQNCHDGLMVSCDDLYWVAPTGSDYELYGITCGGRRIGIFAGGHCERDFNRELTDN